MMKEQLISFETAKLAKEKGFDIPCNYYYYQYVNEDHEDVKHNLSDFHNLTEDFNNDYLKLKKYSASTQSLLQKFIRERLGIDIYISGACLGSDEMEYKYTLVYLPEEFENAKRHVKHLVYIESFIEGFGTYSGAWPTYEETLEEAEKKALTIKI